MRVTPDCDSIGSFFISQANSVQLSPDVAYGGGSYMVVWSDSRAGAYQYSIYAARITPSGTVLDPNGIKVGPAGQVAEWAPSVVFAGDRFLSVWGHNDSPFRLYGRFIDANGQTSDTIGFCPADTDVYVTRVAYDGTNFFVAWLEGLLYPTQIKGLLVSGNGTPIGGPFTIATGAKSVTLGLCFDGTNFCVTYGTTGIWGRKYDRQGQPVGSAFRVSNSTGDNVHCSVVPGANNRYLNVWATMIGGNVDLYGNIDVPITAVAESEGSKSTGLCPKSTLVRYMVHLPGAEGKLATMSDVLGRSVGTSRCGRFDCRRLESGVYFIKVETGERFKVVKIR